MPFGNGKVLKTQSDVLHFLTKKKTKRRKSRGCCLHTAVLLLSRRRNKKQTMFDYSIKNKYFSYADIVFYQLVTHYIIIGLIFYNKLSWFVSKLPENKRYLERGDLNVTKVSKHRLTT